MEGSIDSIEKNINAVTETMTSKQLEEEIEKENKKLEELSAASLEKQILEVKNQIYNENSRFNSEVESKYRLQKNLLENQVNTKQTSIKFYQEEVNRLNQNVLNIQKEIEETAKIEFVPNNEDSVCPTCGSVLKALSEEKQKEIFDKQIKEKNELLNSNLEENKNKTLRDLLSIACQTPLHLKWNSVDKELLKPAYDDLFGDGGFCLYDHFGSIESSNLLEKIRFLITSENCDFIIFDHVSIAISGLDESSMNERKAIDMLMTQLRSLVEETGAGIVVVSHLRKGDTKSTPFEQGGIISLDDLRGSGSLKQLPDTVLALERNQQADEEDSRNVLKIRVLKCRFTGNTGLAGYLKFNKTKNILEDVDPLEIKTEGEDDKCQF